MKYNFKFKLDSEEKGIFIDAFMKDYKKPEYYDLDNHIAQEDDYIITYKWSKIEVVNPYRNVTILDDYFGYRHGKEINITDYFKALIKNGDFAGLVIYNKNKDYVIWQDFKCLDFQTAVKLIIKSKNRKEIEDKLAELAGVK